MLAAPFLAAACSGGSRGGLYQMTIAYDVARLEHHHQADPFPRPTWLMAFACLTKYSITCERQPFEMQLDTSWGVT